MAFQRPSGLIIADNIATVKRRVYFCSACVHERSEAGEEPLGFTADEYAKYERHVVRCAEKHEGELRALSLREQAPGIFGDEGWDTDMEQWVRENADAINEGRLKI